MTKEEITGKRPLGFSAWSREKLKDSKDGLIWTDIDCFLHDYKLKKYMLIEVKSVNGHLGFPQSGLIEFLDKSLRIGAKQAGYDYWGFYLIRMSGERPDESNELYLNDAFISETDLIKHLNFERKYEPLKLI